MDDIDQLANDIIDRVDLNDEDLGNSDVTAPDTTVKAKKPRPPKTEKQLEAFRNKCLTAKQQAVEERRKLRQAVQARVEYNPEEDDAVKVIRYLKSYRAKQLLERMVSEMDLTVLDQADPDEHALIQLAESIRVNDEPAK